MISLTEHQLLLFWLQLLVLLLAARGLGGMLRRLGQPAVVGELAAGLLVGPSVLGRVAPGVHATLFPGDPAQQALLLAVAWVGVALLLVVTGFETDLRLVRRLGRSSAWVAVGSLVVPLAAAFAFGLTLPASFRGAAADRGTFALFVALALSITALAVIAKILTDLRLLRRNVGQVSLAAAMANDLVGWVLLGTFAGIVSDGGFRVSGVVVTVAAIAAFVAVALTRGQRAVDAALRRARQRSGLAGTLAVVLIVMLASAVITQLIGVEAVLGAFLAGIVIGRSRLALPEARQALEGLTGAFFAPLFFATAGLRVDVGLLIGTDAGWWALAAVAVAVAGKTAGALLGACLGRMPRREGLAVAVGLNARGTLEIVVATVGLSLGVFAPVAYTTVIILALVTSMATPPLLRHLLRDLDAGPEEAARLDREAVLRSSVIAATHSALLPTRGGANSLLAARLLDLSLQRDTAVTVLTVHGAGEPRAKERAAAAAAKVSAALDGRAVKTLDRPTDDPAGAICGEASLGYGLVALGMTEGFSGGHALSPVLRDVLATCTVPVLLVRAGAGVDLDDAGGAQGDGQPSSSEELAGVPGLTRLTRIMVPATGTKVGQAAQELAYTLSVRVSAEVDVVHIVDRPDLTPQAAPGHSGTGVLQEARILAGKYGSRVNPMTRSGTSVGRELARTAAEHRADLLVLGAKVRLSGGRPFLGHGVEYLLEHAEQTLLVVVFPAHLEAGG